MPRKMFLFRIDRVNDDMKSEYAIAKNFMDLGNLINLNNGDSITLIRNAFITEGIKNDIIKEDNDG